MIDDSESSRHERYVFQNSTHMLSTITDVSRRLGFTGNMSYSEYRQLCCVTSSEYRVPGTKKYPVPRIQCRVPECRVSMLQLILDQRPSQAVCSGSKFYIFSAYKKEKKFNKLFLSKVSNLFW